MSAPETASGRLLWSWLPEVYRTRDDGDLAQYVDACGELLDRVRNTLDQRLADCFPDAPPDGRASQSWLLPYFADLLGVELRSPRVVGRREEVAKAVRWRQRKGTPAAVDEIAQAVAQLEVVVQEGWQRVATTARIGMPLLPERALGFPPLEAPDDPQCAARHPGLPAVTPDFGVPSRAVRADPTNPAARTSSIGGESISWRPGHPHGIPCFPGSYEDGSRRTVDVRTADARRGHVHPRRVLLFAPPPVGFFAPGAHELAWGDREDAADAGRFRFEGDDTPDPRLSNPARGSGVALPGDDVVFTTRPPPFETSTLEIRDLCFTDTLTLRTGSVKLRRVAARRLRVETVGGPEVPVIDAVDCLFEEVEAVEGLVRLEYCTVLGSIDVGMLQASDCLFAGAVALSDHERWEPSCARYSRIPPELAALPEDRFHAVVTNTTDVPIFIDYATCEDGAPASRSLDFGQPGCGVLDSATPLPIASGAEDGGEMGAYHHRFHRLAAEAVLEKLRDFLPMGAEPVLIPDSRLLQPPPLVSDDTDV